MRSPHRRFAVPVVVLAAVLGVGAVIAPADAARPSRGGQVNPVAPTAPPRTYGLATAGAPWDLSEIEMLTARTGSAPTQVSFYSAWATTPDFPAAAAANVAAAGAVPEIVWEPWDPAAGVVQPAYTLASIASGAHDAYLKRWAAQVRSYSKPVVLRLAHEANGTWYPWSVGVNTNTSAQYVAAWRRVVDLFRRAKVTNVTWTWVGNVPYPGSTPLSQLYPGDSYVDRVGLDGYNWGTTQSWSTWQSFGEVFGAGVAEVDAISTKPIHITETGSTEAGGDKAAWVRDAWAWLTAHPEVRGVTWFSFNKETDWRIDSSEAALSAFTAGISTFRAS